MTEGICFADVELPFHVWVRERTGDEGYRWVLKETRAENSAGAGDGRPEPPELDKAAA